MSYDFSVVFMLQATFCLIIINKKITAVCPLCHSFKVVNVQFILINWSFTMLNISRDGQNSFFMGHWLSLTCLTVSILAK